MKNQLQVFNYESNEVRTIEKNSEPWFVLKDVCEILNLGNSRMVSERLDEDEKGVSQIDTLGGKQNMTIISESGLYKVILRSDKPEANELMRFVTHEVLPSIRKTGGYNESIARARLLARTPKYSLPYVLAELGIEPIITDDTSKPKPIKLKEPNVGCFVNERLMVNSDGYIFFSELYNLYLAYCMSKNIKQKSKKVIAEVLRESGFSVIKSTRHDNKTILVGYVVKPLPTNK